MPLNFGQIKTRYDEVTGTTSVRASLAMHIDDAQIEIAKRYGTIVRHEYADAETGEEYDLPDDHLRTEQIRDEDNELRYDYQITADGKIIFSADGTYFLHYTKVPENIAYEDNDAEPEVHQVFHGMILQYCLSKYWEEQSEGIPAEEAKSQKMLTEFYRKVDEAAHELRKRAYAHEYLDVHPIAR